MTDQHPITPSPELVMQWYTEAKNQLDPYYNYVATQAARWGADQELGACCEWLVAHGWFGSSNHDAIRGLRRHRRPKPPSLAEQALEDFDGLMSELDGAGNYNNCAKRIRRALERLQELEGANG